MATVSVTNTTATTCTVFISGMNTNYARKQIVFYIKGPYDSDWVYVDIIGDSDSGYLCPDGTYEYTYRYLDPDTFYDFKIDIAMLVFPGGVEPFMNEAILSGSFQTEHGGTPGTPFYDFTYNSTSVTITISNLTGYYTYYHCEDGGGTVIFDTDDYGRGINLSQLITGLRQNTTYWIKAGYSGSQYGSITDIENTDGQVWSSFTTPGGGGGDNWSYTETSVIWDISSTTLAPYNLSQGIGQYFGVTFARSGTAAIGVPSGANVDLFYTSGDYGFDPSDGFPYTSTGGNKAESRHYHQFEVVSNTLYYVWIKGSTTIIDGGSNIEISIHDSGGNWSYSSTTAVTVASGTTRKQISLSSRVGQYFQLNFLNSGTAIVEVPTTANVHLFVTNGDYGYDPYDGFPYESSGGSKAESHFSFTLNVTSGSTYYVWVKGIDSSVYGNYSIDISMSGGWRYVDDQSVHEDVYTAFTESVTLQAKVGSYFGVTFLNNGTVTFAFDGSHNAYLYVTAGYNGYNPTTGEPSDAIAGSGGTSLTTTVNAGTVYFVWVRGSTENVYGSVPVTVTPGQQWLVTTISTTEISTSTVPVSFYLSAGYMYCIPVRFTQPCNARFYSTGGYNRVAWLTSSNNDIDRNTGTPNGTILASDTSGDGDYDFSYSVTATTYYFWVRSTSFNDTTLLSANFEPQISSGGKVWIYTSGGWKQATPWIYTANGWKQATPWIYTANGWKQTT